MSSSEPKAPAALVARMAVVLAEKQRRHRTPASDWDGQTYGYGAARANPSVEFASCPACKALPGQLCRGPRGPHWSVHYLRSREYQRLRTLAKQQAWKERPR